MVLITALQDTCSNCRDILTDRRLPGDLPCADCVGATRLRRASKNDNQGGLDFGFTQFPEPQLRNMQLHNELLQSANMIECVSAIETRCDACGLINRLRSLCKLIAIKYTVVVRRKHSQ